MRRFSVWMLLSVPYGGCWFHTKNLLEWNPSNVRGNNNRINLLRTYKTMLISPAVVFVILIYFGLSKQAVPVIALPILFLWLASPAITWWISLPLARREAKLSTNQKLFLRNLSRKTWSFFETFVGPEDNWLPPDNYQENPVATVAHRTSPTNMGLALLANLSAYDFGYITAGKLIERTSNAFRTMGKLERYRGHFLNWYDTQSLLPLRPLYISSVDSGNLAGHILTLRQGILALPDHKIIEPQIFEGILDTLRILIELDEKHDQAQLTQLQKDLELNINSPTITLSTLWQRLKLLTASAEKLEKNYNSIQENQAAWWANALAKQCRNAFNELTFFAPWHDQPASHDIMSLFPNADNIPTLHELAKLDKELPHIIGQQLSDETDKKAEQIDDI